MQRVAVVGNSGSGKTTLAGAVAAAIGGVHVELDGIYHQPDWEPLPDAEFRRRVEEATRGPSWVVDGNYSVVRDVVWARADTVLWLDPPRTVVMRRIVHRTLVRGALRRELWNGNRESLRNFLHLDPQRSIVAWAWTRHDTYREQYAQAAVDPAWAHLRFVRLTTRDDVAELLADLRA